MKWTTMKVSDGTMLLHPSLVPVFISQHTGINTLERLHMHQPVSSDVQSGLCCRTGHVVQHQMFTVAMQMMKTE